MVISLLVFFGFSWAQCPEDTVDLGDCDTLHVVPWIETDTCFADHYYSGGQWHYDTICINDPGENFPCFLYVNLFVTHDSNTFYWEAASKWVQDSIQAFVVPLGWTRTNQTAYCSLSGYWNENVVGWWDANFGRSMWRHIPRLGSDSLNRMEWFAENGQTWGTMIADMSSDSVLYSGVMVPPHVFISLVAGGTKQKWWEGDRTLLATLTFRLEDSLTICIDSTFWPPENSLVFIRYDAPNYVPRNNMPLCIWGGPPILVTFPNGGESLAVSDTHDITWVSENFNGNVMIEYSTDGGVEWDTIIANTTNDGVHTWNIPNAPSTECRVRVSDAADGDPYDISDGDFSIVVPPPDFTIEAEPGTLTVVAGESVGCDVILDSLYGFSSSCNLTVEEDSLPGSTTYDFNPVTVVPPDTSILTFHTDVSTPAGTSTIIITGSEIRGEKNGIEHSTQVVLIVTPPPDFAIAVLPETLKVPLGYSGDYEVTLTSINGFDSPCTLKVGDLPVELTATFEDSVLVPTDTTILTIAVPDMAALDTLPLIVTATEVNNGKVISHSDTVTLMITLPDWQFKIKASPDTQRVVQGDLTTYKVTIIPKVGFTALCTLFVEGLPDVDTAYFDPNPIPPNDTDTSTLTITTLLTTPPDTYELAIIGVANPRQKDTTSVILIVEELTDVEDESDQLSAPDKFALFQNQPNPFNPETKISYYLPEGCEVKLTIYNILGRRVMTLFEGYQTPGTKTLVWDGKDNHGRQLGSGIYFYRLQAGEFTQTRKMTLIK